MSHPAEIVNRKIEHNILYIKSFPFTSTLSKIFNVFTFEEA